MSQNKPTLQFIKFLVEQKLIQVSDSKGFYFYGPFLTNLFEKLTNKFANEWKDSLKIIAPTILKAEIYELQQNAINSSKDIFKIEKQLLLKATSESILYNSKFYKRAVQSYKLLPVKFYLKNKVYRAESRYRPLIRQNEFTLIEIHEIHTLGTTQVAFNFAVQRYKSFLNWLNLKYLVNERPANDRFPGAVKTIAFDTVMNGKRLQIATVHNLSDNFSKIYDVKTKNASNQFENVGMLSHGWSERLLAALLEQNFKNNIFRFPTHLRLLKVIIEGRITVDPDLEILADELQYLKTKDVKNLLNTILH